MTRHRKLLQYRKVLSIFHKLRAWKSPQNQRFWERLCMILLWISKQATAKIHLFREKKFLQPYKTGPSYPCKQLSSQPVQSGLLFPNLLYHLQICTTTTLTDQCFHLCYHHLQRTNLQSHEHRNLQLSHPQHFHFPRLSPPRIIPRFLFHWIQARKASCPVLSPRVRQILQDHRPQN